jgi:hypothetical protein
MTKCNLFQNNVTLLVSPYQVQSSVSLSIFREFLSALDGNAIKITDTNYTELERLCNEFCFTELAAKLSEFRPSLDLKEAETEDADARGRIAVLEETTNQHSHVIAILEDKVTELSTDFGRLVGDVSSLRSAAAGIQILSEEVAALKTQIGRKQNLNDSVPCFLFSPANGYFPFFWAEPLRSADQLFESSTVAFHPRRDRSSPRRQGCIDRGAMKEVQVPSTGVRSKPFIIVSRATAQAELRLHGHDRSNTYMASQGHAFMAARLFELSATEVFFPLIDPRRTESNSHGKAVLLMNGLGGHDTDRFLEQCVERGVEILFLVPHASDQTQPLGLMTFALMKQRDSASKFNRLSNPNRTGGPHPGHVVLCKGPSP